MKGNTGRIAVYIIAALTTAIAVSITVTAMLARAESARDGPEIIVYKTPACGCCANWVEHLRNNGLDAKVVNRSSTGPVHKRLGVPRELGSCHTAKVGDYWVEGHVPADLVQRLITDQPDDISGIAVPGMPMGSPGMEGPNPVEYEVIAYGTDGSTSVYAVRQGRTAPQ